MFSNLGLMVIVMDLRVEPKREEILETLKTIYDARSYSFGILHSDSKEDRQTKRREIDLLNRLEGSKYIVMSGFSANTLSHEMHYKDILITNAGIQHLMEHGVLDQQHQLDCSSNTLIDVGAETAVDQELDQSSCVVEESLLCGESEKVITEEKAKENPTPTSIKSEKSKDKEEIPQYLVGIVAFPAMAFAAGLIYVGFDSGDLTYRFFGSGLLITIGITVLVSEALRIDLIDKLRSNKQKTAK